MINLLAFPHKMGPVCSSTLWIALILRGAALALEYTDRGIECSLSNVANCVMLAWITALVHRIVTSALKYQCLSCKTEKKF